jgi:hypothetical protein
VVDHLLEACFARSVIIFNSCNVLLSGGFWRPD